MKLEEEGEQSRLEGGLLLIPKLWIVRSHPHIHSSVVAQGDLANIVESFIELASFPGSPFRILPRNFSPKLRDKIQNGEPGNPKAARQNPERRAWERGYYRAFRLYSVHSLVFSFCDVAVFSVPCLHSACRSRGANLFQSGTKMLQNAVSKCSPNFLF